MSLVSSSSQEAVPVSFSPSLICSPGAPGAAASYFMDALPPATTFPEADCSVDQVSRIRRLGRLTAIAGTTAWSVARVHTGAESCRQMQRWAISILRTLQVNVEISGDVQTSSTLWVSNHLSWLDPLVLLSLRPMGILAKAEVAQYPVIGSATRKLGLAFVDRSDPTSRAAALARLAAELRRRKPMLLFPEGTTTRGERLAPLHQGGLRAAFRCDRSVQTFRLGSPDPAYAWIGDDSLLPHLLNLIAMRRTRVLVQAGPVFEPRRFSCEDHWLAAIRQELTPNPC